MEPEELDTVEALVAERVFQSLARNLVVEGTIDPAGKSPEEVRKLVAAYVRANIDIEFQLTIDHQQELLDEAERQRDEGRTNYALIFYATWMEHALNGALSTFGARIELSELDYLSLVRLSLREKMGAVWFLVTGVQFPADLRSRALRLADARNRFVHYKWQAASEEPLELGEAREAALMELAEGVVRDLTTFSKKLIFGDNDDLADWAHR